MKTTLLSLFFLLSFSTLFAQQSPEWLKIIQGPNDSTEVRIVKTLTNYNDNNVLVLYNLVTNSGSNGNDYKIGLTKLDENGGVIWDSEYDNGAGGLEAYDMILDSLGMCYIAGIAYDTARNHAMLMKVGPHSWVVWTADTVANFNMAFHTIHLHHAQLYLASTNGVAAFDLNGNSKWAKRDNDVSGGDIDAKGRLLVTAHDTVKRYDRNGNPSSIATVNYAIQVKTYFDSSIYVLSGYTSNTPYYLYKYNYAGNLQWKTNILELPFSPPFGGDNPMLHVDYYGDVVLTGISDTVFKFSSAGDLLWKKSMDGLGVPYGTSASAITQDNFVAVSGYTRNVTGDSDTVTVRLYNIKGEISWQGQYISNKMIYSAGLALAFNGDGVYLARGMEDSVTVAKFDSPFGYDPDFTQFCVDSVWYDAQEGFINVRVFNGSTGFINYPSIQGVAANGDTIINPGNRVNFFGQLANSYQVYTDSVSQQGITDFSGFTFILNEGFGDTSNPMYWCPGSLGTKQPAIIKEAELIVYPNPASDMLLVKYNSRNTKASVYNCAGVKISEHLFSNATLNSIDVSKLTPGIYIMQLQSRDGLQQVKFVKQ